ncbi:MAG: hypothetical protein ACR2Q4_22875, partial [Geminicoccaceae bacterium]
MPQSPDVLVVVRPRYPARNLSPLALLTSAFNDPICADRTNDMLDLTNVIAVGSDMEAGQIRRGRTIDWRASPVDRPIHPG